MKKFIFFLMLLIAMPLVIFAQDVPVPPQDLGDIIMNPGKWITSFTAVTLLTAFISTFFIGLLKVVKNFPRQVIAWVVAIIILVATDLFNIGYAKDFPVVLAVIHGFGAGLAANGVFDIPLVKGFLDAIEKLLNPDA